MTETETGEADKSTNGVAKQTGGALTAILLALILKSTLDAFFGRVNGYNSGTDLVKAIDADLAWSFLVLGQLIVFVFSVTRFYWGSIRYHEEAPEDKDTPHLVVGLVGAILVFATFYVTGLLVKNPTMFYWSLAAAHIVDLFWFIIAAAWLEMSLEIQKLWSWYILFDAVTVVLLLGLILVAAIWPGAKYECSLASLVGVAAIGVWDVKKFWPYYANEANWKQKLPRKLGKTD